MKDKRDAIPKPKWNSFFNTQTSKFSLFSRWCVLLVLLYIHVYMCTVASWCNVTAYDRASLGLLDRPMFPHTRPTNAIVLRGAAASIQGVEPRALADSASKKRPAFPSNLDISETCSKQIAGLEPNCLSMYVQYVRHMRGCRAPSIGQFKLQC